ncbi:MAG: 50S ribosomal protein L21 [Methyloceanibacter sp.]
MFAVIRTGGKQYRVAPNDIIEIEKIAGEPGDIVELGEVLLLGGDSPKTGNPTIAGTMVAAEVIAQKLGDKVIVFKKKRRKGYRRTKGHRQALTALRITEILTDGKKAAAKPEPKKAEKKPDEAKAKPAAKPEAKKTEAKPAAKKTVTKPAAKKAADKRPAKSSTKARAKKPAAKPNKK